MKKLIVSIIIACSAFSIVPIYGEGQNVYDDADLLTEDEIDELESRIDDLEERYNIEIACVTTDDAKGKSAMVYAEDFYDDYFGEDGMLFLIDMDNREIYDTYSGTMIDCFSDKRQEKIRDDAYEYIVDEDYVGTFESYLDGAEHYLKIEFKTFGEKMKTFLLRTIIVVPVSILIGYFMMRMKTRKKRTYERREKIQRNLINDIHYKTNIEKLVNTDTTRVYVPPQKNSGGGSGTSTHTSSSGRTHSGGGRKF